MVFWLIVGIGIGYFFKPQLDILVGKVVRMVKDNKKDFLDRNDDDRY